MSDLAIRFEEATNSTANVFALINELESIGKEYNLGLLDIYALYGQWQNAQVA